MRPRSSKPKAVPTKKAKDIPAENIKPGRPMYVLRKDHAKKTKIT